MPLHAIVLHDCVSFWAKDDGRHSNVLPLGWLAPTPKRMRESRSVRKRDIPGSADARRRQERPGDHAGLAAMIVVTIVVILLL